MRPHIKSGEWILGKNGFQFECCDCGLVHILNFDIEDGEIIFQAFRDNRKTAATRRARSISPLEHKVQNAVALIRFWADNVKDNEMLYKAYENCVAVLANTLKD